MKSWIFPILLLGLTSVSAIAVDNPPKFIGVFGDVENQNKENNIKSETEKSSEIQLGAESKTFNCPEKLCPDNTVVVGKRCYRYSSTSTNWTNAKADCESQGGYLAIPDFSNKETLTNFRVVYKDIGSRNCHYSSNAYIWIGAVGNSGITFSWVDGSVLPNDHPHWKEMQPSTVPQCVNLVKITDGILTISHSPCTSSYAYICQFKPLTN